MLRLSRLNHPMTIREVADMAGWSYDRMKAHLLRLHAESGHTLLVSSAPPNRRYTLMLPALRRVAPGLFEPIENLAVRVDAIEEQQKDLDSRQKRIAMQVAENVREILRLKSRRGLSRRVGAKEAPEAVG